MRVTLFWYMRVSPFVEFTRCCSGHTGEAQRVGPAPKCRRSAFSEGPERSLHGVVCRGSQTCFGRNRDPAGAPDAKQKTERRRAPERPRSRDRAKDGAHNGRHAPEQNYRWRTGRGSSPPTQPDPDGQIRRQPDDSATSVAYRKAVVRHSQRARVPVEATQPDWQHESASLSLLGNPLHR